MTIAYGQNYDTAGDPWSSTGQGTPQAPQRQHLRDRLLSLDDLADMPPVRPLVAGLLYREMVAQISGQPGSYKSFVTVGIACSVALGMTWEGHAVPESGPVVYVAPEGASGLRARVMAWCSLSGVDPAQLDKRLLFLPEPVQLGNRVDVTEAVEVAAELRALLLVLDTRARCTVGLEENSATDQGKAIDAAERIQRKSGATVLAVHHSGRGGDHGRGSNAWDGAVWSDLRIEGDELRCKVHCAKHKDVPDGCDHRFRLVPHTVPQDLMPGCDDRQRSTLVAVQMGYLDTQAGERRSARTVLDTIRTAAGSDGVTRAMIATLTKEGGLGRSATYCAINVLVRDRVIRNVSTTSVHRFAAHDGLPE